MKKSDPVLLLKRLAIVPIERPDSEVNPEIMDYAKKRLDYRHPTTAWEMIQKAKKLSLTIQSLGIKPFTTESVKEFKSAMTAMHMPRSKKREKACNFPQWKSWSLSSYPKEIPEFVLGLAKEIHLRVAKVEFEIFEFVMIGGKTGPCFLVVKLREEKFYLEAWREPGYKERFMA